MQLAISPLTPHKSRLEIHLLNVFPSMHFPSHPPPSLTARSPSPLSGKQTLVVATHLKRNSNPTLAKQSHPRRTAGHPRRTAGHPRRTAGHPHFHSQDPLLTTLTRITCSHPGTDLSPSSFRHRILPQIPQT